MDSSSPPPPSAGAAIENAVASETNTLETIKEPPLNDLIHSSSPTQKVTSFTTSTLEFLANASSETLGACTIGLCASTYFILGRVGLVLIGAVGGIVLHATWETSGNERSGPQGNLHPNRSKKRELGLEVAKRVLDWREGNKSSWSEDTQLETERSEGLTASTQLNSSEFRPETGAALHSLIDAVIRDYIQCVMSYVSSASSC